MYAYIYIYIYIYICSSPDLVDLEDRLLRRDAAGQVGLAAEYSIISYYTILYYIIV